MRTSSISVVLPIYRTAQYLNELYDRLVAALEPCCGQFEIIMVDDGSPDGAWRIISELAANDPRIKGIRLSRNFGQHPAINAGFDVTNGDVVVLMDADLQDRPEDIPLLLEQLTDDKDIVFTIKREEGVPFSTRLTSHIYHGLFSRITGASVPKNVGTLRLFTRRFLDAVLSYPERNVLFGPLMFHVGFEHSVVEVHRPARMAGAARTPSERGWPWR